LSVSGGAGSVRWLRSGVLESFVNFEMGIFADHRDLAPWHCILARLWWEGRPIMSGEVEAPHQQHHHHVVAVFGSRNHFRALRTQPHIAIMFKFLLLLGLWALTASAQFGFFDQMFHGGGHQQQQQQQTNVRSDSSWYQAQYSNGQSIHISAKSVLVSSINTLQRNAHTTSAPAPSPACTSLTTVPAHGKPTKTRSNWVTVSPSVDPRAGGRRASLPRRSSWPGRDCCRTSKWRRAGTAETGLQSTGSAD
jgi:hypothetical protein